MDQIYQCLFLYIGCDTNQGKFIGIINNTLLIQTKEKQVEEYDQHLLGNQLLLHLQFLSDITHEQSKELIKKGLSIGRPFGYSFSNYGFLYLLSLHVDLFGLINAGLARRIKSQDGAS
jgi:hypothetical protein